MTEQTLHYEPRFLIEVEVGKHGEMVRVPYHRTEDRMSAYSITARTDVKRNVWLTDHAETGPGSFAFRRGYYNLSSPALDFDAANEYLRGVIERLTDQALDRFDKYIDSLPPIG